jgi:DNA polymerase III epsilon subunit-like protein
MAIAIVDFETMGLNAGRDRVVEVSVVTSERGRDPEMVFDTFINPARSVLATVIDDPPISQSLRLSHLNQSANQVVSSDVEISFLLILVAYV